ncbi:hypothetical protein RhoFasSB10_03024 [Rhodococcus fascians]|nr:hypothetical protein [Rhodococcus fascians]
MSTTLEVALANLAEKQLKSTTIYQYRSTLRVLDLEDVPFDQCTIAFLHNRLQSVINPSTRNKHAVALRSMLGVQLKVGKGSRRSYRLAELDLMHDAIGASRYKMFGFSMLYAGLRLGEAVVKQHLEGNVLHVDRQRIPNGTITAAKSVGPVVVPSWFAELYAMWEPQTTRNNVYLGLQRTGNANSMTLNPHALRHKFATELVNNGCSPEMLRRQLRHHDVTVSLKYYVETEEHKLVDKIESTFGGMR